MTQVEQDFWTSANPQSSLSDWPFEDDPRTRAFLSAPVQTGAETITCVAHEAEGDWHSLSAP